MKRRTLLLSVAGGALLVALLAWAFAPRPMPVELATAAVGPFETTIDEDARTRLADRYVVAAPLAGRLARSTLREGDAVEAGAVVATLRPVPAPMLDERSLGEQRARVGAAEAGVARARTRIDAARLALEKARVDLRRTEQLAQQGFVAPTRIDADRLAAQAAQKELETAVEGERIARHELALARATLGIVQGGAAPGGAFELRSPVAGRVLKVHHRSETTVAAGTPLVELGDLGRLEIVAELLTADALQAQPGSPVRIERWGGPGMLEGRVRRVEPAAFTKVSALGVEEQRVNVIIDLLEPRERWAALGDGYRVAVRIVTRSEPAVLRVPVSAVFPLPADAATRVVQRQATSTAGGAADSAAGAAASNATESAAATAVSNATDSAARTAARTAATTAATTAASTAASTAAVHPAATTPATHAVFRFDNRRARLAVVQLGARNAGEAWIRAGLEPGDRVIVYPPAGVTDGARVRERGLSRGP